MKKLVDLGHVEKVEVEEKCLDDLTQEQVFISEPQKEDTPVTMLDVDKDQKSEHISDNEMTAKKSEADQVKDDEEEEVYEEEFEEKSQEIPEETEEAKQDDQEIEEEKQAIRLS